VYARVWVCGYVAENGGKFAFVPAGFRRTASLFASEGTRFLCGPNFADVTSIRWIHSPTEARAPHRHRVPPYTSQHGETLHGEGGTLLQDTRGGAMGVREGVWEGCEQLFGFAHRRETLSGYTALQQADATVDAGGTLHLRFSSDSRVPLWLFSRPCVVLSSPLLSFACCLRCAPPWYWYLPLRCLPCACCLW
jgi:hypothetical protein